MTPAILEDFLPANTLLEDHRQAIHILLDRFDGRTKDYMVSLPVGHSLTPYSSTSRPRPRRRLARSSRPGRTH